MPPPSGHPHTPPPWPASVDTCCFSLAWQEVGWVRIQKAGALKLLQGNYHTLTLHLAKGLWMSQSSARAQIGRNSGTKENQKQRRGRAGRCHSNQTNWGQEEGCSFQLAVISVLTLLYWMGIPRGTSVTSALWPWHSLAFWEEGASKVVTAEMGGGAGGRRGQLAGFQLLLPEDPSQRSRRGRVVWGVMQQRTSPQVAGALELPATSPLLQQWVESRPGLF